MLLSQDAFLSTMGDARQEVGANELPPFDFWPYFEAIPVLDFEGHDCSAGIVEHVLRMLPQPYEHFLIRSEDRNVFMVLVLDITALVVVGHRLLDLNRVYGLDA